MNNFEIGELVTFPGLQEKTDKYFEKFNSFGIVIKYEDELDSKGKRLLKVYLINSEQYTVVSQLWAKKENDENRNS